MTVQRADDVSAADHPFGKRPLPMRAAVLGGEQPAVALPEHGDLLGADDIAAALTLGDSADAAQIDRSVSRLFQPLFSATSSAYASSAPLNCA